MAELIKKNPFFLKSFFISFSFHVGLLLIFIVSLPTLEVPFKPGMNFLGAIFKTQDMFSYDSSLPIKNQPQSSKLNVVFSDGAVKNSHSFVLDKPKKSNENQKTKEYSKTTFLQEESKESVMEEFAPMEKFSLKPLKLDSHDKN